jgi:hypothetical protein
VTPRNSSSGPFLPAAFGALIAIAWTAGVVSLACAQTAPAPVTAAAAPPASAQAPAPVPPQPATAIALPPQPSPPGLPEQPAEKRGFLNNFGTWWDKSMADFKAKMQEQQTKIADFNKQSADATKEAMKNAADAWVRLPASRVIETQQVCPPAGNGAPDCATAATNFCKGKGFKDGQPLDIRTAEKCAASLWVSDQTPTAADCPNETVLLRVACQ